MTTDRWLQDRIAHIDRMLEHNEREQLRVMQIKAPEPWKVLVGSMIMGAGLFAAGMAFAKFVLFR
jgi:hypothetical protein